MTQCFAGVSLLLVMACQSSRALVLSRPPLCTVTECPFLQNLAPWQAHPARVLIPLLREWEVEVQSVRSPVLLGGAVVGSCVRVLRFKLCVRSWSGWVFSGRLYPLLLQALNDPVAGLACSPARVSFPLPPPVSSPHVTGEWWPWRVKDGGGGFGSCGRYSSPPQPSRAGHTGPSSPVTCQTNRNAPVWVPR